jgi:hypothetical protein
VCPYKFTSRATFNNSSEIFILNQKEFNKLQVTQKQCLQPLTGFLTFNHQRYPDIRDKLNVTVIVEKMQSHQQNVKCISERMERSHLGAKTRSHALTGHGGL